MWTVRFTYCVSVSLTLFQLWAMRVWMVPLCSTSVLFIYVRVYVCNNCCPSTCLYVWAKPFQCKRIVSLILRLVFLLSACIAVVFVVVASAVAVAAAVDVFVVMFPYFWHLLSFDIVSLCTICYAICAYTWKVKLKLTETLSFNKHSHTFTFKCTPTVNTVRWLHCIVSVKRSELNRM